MELNDSRIAQITLLDIPFENYFDSNMKSISNVCNTTKSTIPILMFFTVEYDQPETVPANITVEYLDFKDSNLQRRLWGQRAITPGGILPVKKLENSGVIIITDEDENDEKENAEESSQ